MNRTVIFIKNGIQSNSFLSNKGTPQGSILSLLLFNIYISKISRVIDVNTKILLYADDVVIYSSCKDPRIASNSINISLANISQILRNKGLTLSSKKSQFMLFSRKNNPSHLQHTVFIDNHPLSPCNVVRFLGFLLDPKLTGKSHFEYVFQKCSKINKVISSLTCTSWGAHPKALLTLYRSMIRSVIEYGCHIYQFRNNMTVFKKIQRIQYKAIRLALGYRISTPINVILDKAKELPLSIRLNFLSQKYLYKLLSLNNNPVINSALDIQKHMTSFSQRRRAVRDIPFYSKFSSLQYTKNFIHNSVIPPAFFYDYQSTHYRPRLLLFLTNINSKNLDINEIFNTVTSDLSNDATTFYTDGSKNDYLSAVGAAVFSPELKLKISHKLPHYTSIFSAEAWAIYQALIAALQFNCKKTVIFSDSRSVLDVITSRSSNNRNYLIHLIRYKCSIALSNGLEITFMWVPSHVGIHGNEMADSLASNSYKHGSVPSFLIPYPDLTAKAKLEASNRSEIFFSDAALEKGSTFFSLYHNTSPKPWFHNLPLNRSMVVIINRLRSGHYNLNQSLFRIKLATSDRCSCDLAPQNIDHIIFDCPVFDLHFCYLHLFIAKTSQSFIKRSVSSLLCDPCVKFCRLLVSFSKSIDAFI
ncbi:uncharacterized protein [Cardiocondyla obscurior]|uniref:uncharacterized protein n=1 Tax=Cardiocondyla obscurior TaxID=286306 RepID=UPI0039656D74